MSWAEVQKIKESIDNAVTGGFEVFKSSRVFKIPEGVSKIFVTACGGGGAGMYSVNETYSAGGGGGGDAVVGKLLDVSGRRTLNITVGKGGTATSSTAESGGATLIDDLLTLPGGMHGGSEDYSVRAPGGAAGGQGGGKGGDGGWGGNTLAEAGIWGSAGISSDGNKGGGGGGSLGKGADANAQKGSDATEYGGGGSGGGFGKAGAAAGGNGADGVVLIFWGVSVSNNLSEELQKSILELEVSTTNA